MDKMEKKIALVRTEDYIETYMQSRKDMEAAKAKFDNAKNNLKEHLSGQYDYGMQILSMVYNVCCWVRHVAEGVSSSRSRVVEPHDVLKIRPQTKDEMIIVGKAWDKKHEKAKEKEEEEPNDVQDCYQEFR